MGPIIGIVGAAVGAMGGGGGIAGALGAAAGGAGAAGGLQQQFADAIKQAVQSLGSQMINQQDEQMKELQEEF